jgi:hypothetical protein
MRLSSGNLSYESAGARPAAEVWIHMQVTEQLNLRADRPRFDHPPIVRPRPACEAPSFRPESEGLSREELRQIVLDLIG